MRASECVLVCVYVLHFCCKFRQKATYVCSAQIHTHAHMPLKWQNIRRKKNQFSYFTVQSIDIEITVRVKASPRVHTLVNDLVSFFPPCRSLWLENLLPDILVDHIINNLLIADNRPISKERSNDCWQTSEQEKNGSRAFFRYVSTLIKYSPHLLKCSGLNIQRMWILPLCRV